MSWRVGSVVALRPESPTARTLVLDVPGWPGHNAGQHVDVRLTAPDGYSAVRSYSVASAPAPGRVEITVEQVPDGEVSPYLALDVAVGDQLEIRGPIGGWFIWSPTQPDPVQLLAGGSGLVPLMSMIRARLATGSTTPMRLLYSIREPDSSMYADDLAELGAHGIDVTYAYTRRTPDGWPRPAGRIDAEMVRECVVPPGDYPVGFVCGPTGFVEAASELLIAVGYDRDRIKTERFGPSGP